MRMVLERNLFEDGARCIDRYSSQHQEGLHPYVNNERSEQHDRRSSARSVMLCYVNWVESVLK